MRKHQTEENIRDLIQVKIDYPSDMKDWDYDLMLDFIEASDFVAMPEIADIVRVSRAMTEHDLDAALSEMR